MPIQSFVDNFYSTQRQGELLDAEKLANETGRFDLTQKKLLAEQAARFYAAQAAPSGVKPAAGAMPSGAIGEVPNAAVEAVGGTMPGAVMKSDIPGAAQPPTALQLMQGQLATYDAQLQKLASVKDTPQGFAASQALMKDRAGVVEKMAVAQKDQFEEDRKAAQDNLDKWAGVGDQQSLNYVMASAPQAFKQKLAQVGIFPNLGTGQYDYNDQNVQRFIQNAKVQSLTQVQRFEQEARAAETALKAKNQVTLEEERKAKTAQLYSEEAFNRERAKGAGKHYDALRGGWSLPPDEAGNSKFVPSVNPNGNTSGLTPEAMEQAASQYNADGKMPISFRDQATRTAVMNRAAEMLAGASGPGARAEFKANSSALTAVTKDLAAITPYKEMLDTNIGVAKQLASKAIATDSKFANKTLNWLRQNATDNPDVSEYLAQMHFVSTESARVLTNPRLVGQLTDSAIKDMQGVISGDMPLNATVRVLDRIASDGQNRVSAMEKQHAELTKKLSGTRSSDKPKTGFQEGMVYQDAAGNKAKYVGGQWVAQ